MTPSSRASLVVALGLLVLAAGLRFSGLDTQSFWTDEGISLVFARGSASETVEMVSRDYHPPLYFLLLNGWTKLFGTGEVAVRSLSALFSLAAVLFTWAVGRRLFGAAPGWLAGLLAACSVYQLFYAQEARPYAMLACLSAASMTAYVAWLRKPGAKSVALYLLASVPLLYTQYMGFFVILCQNLHFSLGLMRGCFRERLRGWMLAELLLGASFLVWFPTFRRQFGVVEEGFWIDTPSWGDLGQISLVLLCYRWKWWSWVAFAAGAAVGMLAWWQRGRATPFEHGGPTESREEPPALFGASLVAIWFFVPIILAFVLSLKGIRVFHHRSLAMVSPAVFLVTVALCQRVPRPIGAAVFSLVLGASVATLPYYSTRVHKHNYRAAAAFVAESDTAQDEVLFEPAFFQAAFDHYHPREIPMRPPGTPPTASRVWCVIKTRWPQGQQMLRWLQGQRYRVTESKTFRLIEVHLLERP